jgi:peptidoglycan endopeptidase LytE
MAGRSLAIITVLMALVFFLAPDAYSRTHPRTHARKHARNHVRTHVQKHAVTDAGTLRHRVMGGETVYSIGKMYNVELAQVRRLNHIKGNRIKVGQELRIPGNARPVMDAGMSAGPVEVEAGQGQEKVQEQSPSGPAAPEASEGAFTDVRVWDIERCYEGVPYRFGGSGMDGIDCSGFTKSVFDSFGLCLPRSAREQFMVGVPVDKAELKRGDLVFFSTYAKYPSHVGIYVGDGRFMHMSTSKSTLEITDLNDGYYVSNYLGARRVLSAQ